MTSGFKLVRDYQAIATHFGVTLKEIIKLTEFYSVFHVVVKGIGSRFVSKAVVYRVGSKDIFNRFRVNSPKEWCLYNLKFLNRLQLRSLCMLLGVESNGDRDNLIKRIKNTVAVLVVIKPYANELYQFIQHYKSFDQDDLTIPLTIQAINKRFIREHKHTELRLLCIQAGLSSDYHQETKQQLSHKLFCWFDNCLVRKQQEFKTANAIANR